MKYSLEDVRPFRWLRAYPIRIFFMWSLLSGLLLAPLFTALSFLPPRPHVSISGSWATVYTTWVAIFIGALSLYLAYSQYRKKEAQENKRRLMAHFPAFEPKTVEEFFLRSFKEEPVHQLQAEDIWIRWKYLQVHFTHVPDGEKVVRTVYNILRKNKKEDPLLFVLSNEGEALIIPVSLTIIFNDNGKYHFIEEDLMSYGPMVQGEDPLYVLATEEGGGDTFSLYEAFYAALMKKAKSSANESASFAVILEFQFAFGEETEQVKRAYVGTFVLSRKVDGGDEIGYIRKFTPLLSKRQVSNYIPEEKRENLFILNS